MEIEIKNFLSFKNEKFITENNLNIFFGLNGSGKSNLLKGLKLLFEGDESEIVYNNLVNLDRKMSNDDIEISLIHTLNFNQFRNYLINHFDYLINEELWINQYNNHSSNYNSAYQRNTVLPFDKNFSILLDKLLKLFERDNLEYLCSCSINKDNIFKKNFQFKSDHSAELNEKLNDTLNKFKFKDLLENDCDTHDKKIMYTQYKEIYDLFYDFFENNFFESTVNYLFKQKMLFWEYTPKNLLNTVSLTNKFINLEDISRPIFNLLNNFDKEEGKEILTKYDAIIADHNFANQCSDEVTMFLNKKIKNFWKHFDDNKFKISIKFQVNEITVSISNEDKYNNKNLINESDGIKQFLSIIFSLILSNINEAIILIDEPEIHLHPGSILSLLSEFKNISTNNILFVASHSPHMLERSSSNISYFNVIFDPENIESNIENINSIEKDNFQNLLHKLFGNDIYYDFMFSKRLLFVEGISDLIIINKLFLEYKKDVLVLPIQGGNGPNIIDSYKKALPNEYFKYKCYVMIDDDQGGKQLYKKIEKDFGDRIFYISECDNEINSIEDIYDEDINKKLKKELTNIESSKNESKSIKVKFADDFVNNFKLNKKYDNFINKLLERIKYER